MLAMTKPLPQPRQRRTKPPSLSRFLRMISPRFLDSLRLGLFNKGRVVQTSSERRGFLLGSFSRFDVTRAFGVEVDCIWY